MDNLPVLGLQGSFYTDYSGIRRLLEFYHEAKQFSNTTIYLDFYHLQWIDANLCALLQSILYKLNVENNLMFSADLNYIGQKFNVLFRNGFINSPNGNVTDEFGSVIVLKNFSSKDKEGFLRYVKEELLDHQAMPKLSNEEEDRIIDSLIELFTNIDVHANTSHPFFVCGQYFPKQRKIVFSMVDLGVGFLPPIHEKTNGEVNTSFDSIKWALIKRNTSKTGSPGGLGLTELHDYCEENGGVLQIITGDTYWSSDLKNTIFDSHVIKKAYCGAMINLHFSCK